MLKKIILGVVFVGLIAFLVIGAINRTSDKTNDTVEAAGRGRGSAERVSNQNVNYQEPQANGRGQGNQGERQTGEFERQYPNYSEAPSEWMTYEGTVSQLPAPGVDLQIETGEGELTVGTGPQDLAEQGFELQLGEAIQVYGYWDDGELKAAQLTKVATNQTVTLRDDMGRPSWSGAGQLSQGSGQGNAVTSGQGNGGQGNSGQGNNGQGNNGRNETDQGQSGPGQAGAGQAEGAAWITLQGTVAEVNEGQLLIDLGSGEFVSIQNRPWWFAQEQGFTAESGDEITLTGFYEGDNFEAGQFTNDTTGLTVQIRQETGRPFWAGGGQRG